MLTAKTSRTPGPDGFPKIETLGSGLTAISDPERGIAMSCESVVKPRYWVTALVLQCGKCPGTKERPHHFAGPGYVTDHGLN